MIVVVVGTRPEIIKMAPVVHALRAEGLEVSLVATGQHHDFAMMGVFLQRFGLAIDHQLERRATDLFGTFADMLLALGPLFLELRPELVLAQGDTTTVLAAALAARKTGSLFGHVEAGLRAFSRELPEEEHRICADVLADLLFAPTRHAIENLTREHVNGQVTLTGNTVLDVLRERPRIEVAASDRDRILVTIHRQETVDDADKLGEVLAALGALTRRHPVIWPVHPRTRAKIAELGLAFPRSLQIVEPLGHDEFLEQLARAKLVITDSGGVQEEAAILGTPCVTVRHHTERPETLDAGVGVMTGAIRRDAILAAADEVLGSWERYARPVPHLYGDGTAGKKIARACADYLLQRTLGFTRRTAGQE